MKFQIFKDGKTVENFALSGSYMFGADSIPLRTPGKIRFRKGFIECTKKSLESAGLTLLWPIDGFGRVLLPTTRLPERKGPYNLNVELARARLMQITLKREDWALFEESDNFADLAHQSKDLFIEAIKNIADSSKASVLADKSLQKAMVFSEKLATRHAEAFFKARCKKRSLGRHSLGCVIDPELMDNEKYGRWLFDIFGFATIPIRWADIEPQRGEYDFSGIDRYVEMLGKKRMAICVGPLLYFSKDFLPKWLLGEKIEFERIREIAYGFVSKVVTRYTKHIHAWRVISGMNAQNHFNFNFEQIIEMTRTACLAARSPDSKSRKMVEILFPWGEYYARQNKAIPPFVYADMVIQSGISFDAFGLQLQFGKDYPGMHVRDMMQISSVLDFFAAVPKPLHITGVGVPNSSGKDSFDVKVAGIWHREWDQSVQSEWIENLYKIAFGKPFIHSITYSTLADTENMALPGSGLLTKELKAKKSFLTLGMLQKFILHR